MIAARPAGGGKLRTDSGRYCRPRGRRRTGRAGARCGRTRARRSVESGGRWGWVISRITSRPPGPQDAGHLADAGVEVGEVADAEADRDGVERCVGVGQLERVGPLEGDVAQAALAAPSRWRARASARRSRSRPRGPPGPTRARSSSARSPVPQQRSSAASPAAKLGPVGGARAPAVVEARRSSPSSSGRRRRRCGRTSPAPRPRTRRPAAGGCRRRRSRGRALSDARKSTIASSFSGGRSPYWGMIPDGLISVRAMPAAGSLAPISVSSGPGPSLPFSPILWQARQPWPATASLPSSYCAGDLHLDLGRASRPRRRGRSGTPSR